MVSLIKETNLDSQEGLPLSALLSEVLLGHAIRAFERPVLAAAVVRFV
jgi:hypothetical protein